MSNIFINSNKKIRIVWRILGVYLTLFVMSILGVIISSFIFQGFQYSNFSAMISNTMDSPFGNAFASILGAVFLFLFFKTILSKEKILFSDLGFVKKNFICNLLLGLLAGIIFILLITVPLYLSKQYLLVHTPLTQTEVVALLCGVLLYTGVAFTEEIAFRGYIQNALNGLGVLKSCCITAILFASMHLVNSSYSPLSLIYLFLGGLLFSLIRIVTKNIWFPIGFHIAWNWTLSTLLGILNENPSKRWLFTDIPQNTIWNGGQNGPESGFIGITVCLVAVFVLIIIVKNSTQQLQK